MGLFGGGYENAGPGVPKNPEEKTVVARFFEIYFRRFWKLLTMNILYFLFFIPFFAILSVAASDSIQSNLKVVCIVALLLVAILTFGPATSGFVKVVRNYSQERNAFLWSDFSKAFRQNYFQSVIMGAVDIVFTVGFVVAIVCYNEWASESSIIYIPFVITLSCMLMFIMMHFFIYLLIVSTNLSLKNILKNSFLLVGVSLKKCLITLVITAFIVLLFVFLYPYSFFILPFWPLSFICFLICFNCFPVIRKYVIDPYYEKRRETSPEYRLAEQTEKEAVFEDKGGQEAPIKAPKNKNKVIK
ncbi:MAG: DUF624 domain-containing protein [Ruminococcus sp.]|nr:DUF624 domain-containing protein [Ruminococcus sp.]